MAAQGTVCEFCDAHIPPTGKRGRPKRRCDECTAGRVAQQTVRPDDAVCEQCGETFGVELRQGPIPRFCSRRCSQDSFRVKHREVRRCRTCDAVLPYSPTGGGQAYCSGPCRMRAKSLRARERAGQPRMVDCAFCGDPFWMDPLKPSQLRRKYCSTACTSQASRDGRRARLTGVEVERIDRHVVFERDEYVCGLCLEPVDRGLSYPHPRSASLDHVAPISQGGSHTYDNVQCSHLECNVRASAKRSQF